MISNKVGNYSLTQPMDDDTKLTQEKKKKENRDKAISSVMLQHQRMYE